MVNTIKCDFKASMLISYLYLSNGSSRGLADHAWNLVLKLGVPELVL